MPLTSKEAHLVLFRTLNYGSPLGGEMITELLAYSSRNSRLPGTGSFLSLVRMPKAGDCYLG
jgi:hypothetical protein